MAIIHCSDCGGEISDRAITCPHCGAVIVKKIKPRASKTAKAITKTQVVDKGRIAFLFGVIIVFVCAGWLLLNTNDKALAIPVVQAKWIDRSQASLLQNRVTVHATIRNTGGEGKVKATFHVYQGGKDITQSETYSMYAGESKEVQKTFENILLINGRTECNVEVKPFF